jgi:bifunctional non-homologous end joining protein LigD
MFIIPEKTVQQCQSPVNPERCTEWPARRYDGYSERMLSRSPSPAWPAGFVEPCLPTLGRTVPEGPRWACEVKHDGFRFICRRDGVGVRVFSRHGKDWSDKVPLIAESLLVLPVKSATLDGEGVVVDDRGLTDFERLRSALAGKGGSRAVFLYGFDLLHLDGEDLRRHPWDVRRATLTALLRKERPGLRLSEHLDGDSETIFRHACALGAEGIVAKRRDRPYRSGCSLDWIKVKNPDAPAALRTDGAFNA